MLQQIIDKISAQQKGKENTAVWGVGEQLKEICKDTPMAVEIVFQDLDIPEMSLEKCEAEIKKYADELHRKNKGNSVFVSPEAAEKIIRRFYGIPEREEKASSGIISLADLI